MKIVRASEIPYIPSSHEDQQNPHVLKKVLFEKGDIAQGRVQMVNWAQLLPGKTFNAHYHEQMTEVFLIIEGIVQMHVDEQELTLTKGDAVIVEPREVHTMTNTTDSTIDYIVFGVVHADGGKTVVTAKS